MPSDHEMLTVSEVADLLRVHPVTVYRMIASRSPHPLKIDGVWRFNPSDLVLLLAASWRGLHRLSEA